MKKIIKSKPFILFILSITMMLMAISLSASNTISDADHKEIIKQYIMDIRTIQNQVFHLSQIILEDMPVANPTISSHINLINNRIEELSKSVLRYTRTTSSISAQNRDALLACIALNLIKNALYQVNMLTTTNNNADKSLLLEDFYLFKRISTETLNTLEDIILRN